MVVIGLTGSIGMGKSATAQHFRSFGIPVHDSDRAVHDLYAGELIGPVGALFPSAIGPNGIDRQALGQIVLNDVEAMKALEQIVHPRVSAHRFRFVEARRAEGQRLVVCDVPLLLEVGAGRTVDVIVVVSAPLSVQKSRVLARPGMTEERLDAIMGKQMPDAEKRRHAHATIDTGRGHPAAQRQVANLLRALAAVSGSNADA